MSRLKDKTVLVTGGAKGMGKLIARRAIEHGAACVILWDVDEAGLAAAADELRRMRGSSTVVDTGKQVAMDVDHKLAAVACRVRRSFFASASVYS